MAFLNIRKVAIKGVSACVPLQEEKNTSSNIFTETHSSEKFIAATGVTSRRLVTPNVTASDLCYEAAEKLVHHLNWDKTEIDCLIFVSQTSDFILPATSCLLQERLGLSTECYTLDISLGCSGWVYGLSTISSLMMGGSMKKGLLLCGDTISKIVSKTDISTYPLFGDAGTATALEFADNAPPIYFHLASDGSGSNAIMIEDGGYRNPVSIKSFERHDYENKYSYRNKLQLSLNGLDVFSFGITKAPESIKKILSNYEFDLDKIDYCILHQANKKMNEMIRKKLKLPECKAPYSLQNFGNTSSASIPLTLVNSLRNQMETEKLSLLVCGFGVGLSWASALISTNQICVPQLIEMP